ncbi:WYL domain-containing protein [Enterocloster lavalensis]|uniref:WYL domain-containing protein n=1 Tax=Enterocloster lavalensis TaxID=460384 RepID=UPI001D096AB1|nr:WYL domain-containing protein [Enterocloster lavalensis]MCB6342687.1 WYL domain-containing protein [Enterocloster lavalensis]
MAEFQELIKNFDRIRDYMRQFYIYGFKARTEFDGKSARTYDNERRRIESWLADYTRADYTSKGKHVYINVDSKEIPQNPLYTAWKSKSFTDNDLMLHFFLLDQMIEDGNENAGMAQAGAAQTEATQTEAVQTGAAQTGSPAPGGLTAGELCDRICADYGVVFDSQTVRLKLKEYESLGLLSAVKDKKQLRYRLAPLLPPETAAPSPVWDRLMMAVKFFQGVAPFGVVGSTILDREETDNEYFQFKHHFIVHTLEDGVLSDVLAAMKQGRAIAFTNRSGRTGNVFQSRGLPLKIFVSTRTGRRYVCLYQENTRRFTNMRLDSMSDVTPLEIHSDYSRKQDLLKRNLDRLWGVSFSGSGRLEEICIKFYVNESTETYVLDRLYREGRGGEIQRIRENEYLYSGAFFDTNEMLSWVKTFTGRILDIQGSNHFAVAKITYDWEKMYEMYCRNGEESGEEI